MHRRTRPPNPLDGSAAVTEAADGGGGVPAAAAAAEADRAPAQSSDGPFEPDSPSLWSRTRSFFQAPLRRLSSGYFSSEGDALLSPPPPPQAPPRRPPTVDRSTQTPSSSAQVILHALQRVAEARGGSRTRGLHGFSLYYCSAQPGGAAPDMVNEEVVEQLRRIGDSLNERLLGRREAARRRQDAFQPIHMVALHQELAMVTCAVLLLFFVSRMIYSRGSTNSHDASQL